MMGYCMGYIVGIDLGTTNSVVAVWRNNNLEIIPDENGNTTLPSVVAFSKKSKYIGREAKAQIELNSANSFYEVKRLIGRKFEDLTVGDTEFLTYMVGEGDRGNIVFVGDDGKKRTAEELSAYILIELKRWAERYLGEKIEKVVVTVPAYFNDNQRQATRNAATIAGLECVRIINEPTAAALAYGLQTGIKEKDINVLVYDLGGGTLDCSVLNIANGIFEVLGSCGNTRLGGADFDNKLIEHCMNEFMKKYNIDELRDLSPVSKQKLKKACEEGKKRLSLVERTIIGVKEFWGGNDLVVIVGRGDMEKICNDLLLLCLKCVDDVMIACGLEIEEIDEVILVGGGSRMISIRERLRMYFGGKELNMSINPDEVVAAGAAVQGCILSDKKDEIFSEGIVLLDIVSLSLGVETIGGVMTVLVERGTVVPVTKKMRFTTDSDFETSVLIKIFEGERKMTKDNFFVGEFVLSGLEAALKGIVQIEIIFNIDVCGIVSVVAYDVKNDLNRKEVCVKCYSGRLDGCEIDKLVKEAKDVEARDLCLRKKKGLWYEVGDVCSAIKANLDNVDLKIVDSDRVVIVQWLDKMDRWLNEKNFDERTETEYNEILEYAKGKYGIMVLRGNKDDAGFKESIDVEVGTGVFEDDENDDLRVFNDNVVDDEMRKEIKRMKDMLVELCYQVFEIVSGIDGDAVANLKDYIDDVLLWIHVKSGIKVDDCHERIDEINRLCNNVVDLNADMVITECSKHDQLEQLCYVLLSNIDSGEIILDDGKINVLKVNIQDVIDWLIDVDLEIRKAQLEGQNLDNDYDELYQQKIDQINQLCLELCSST